LDSAEVLQNQAFIEPPGFYGGALSPSFFATSERVFRQQIAAWAAKI
jgi:hypothetical protein